MCVLLLGTEAESDRRKEELGWAQLVCGGLLEEKLRGQIGEKGHFPKTRILAINKR